MVWLKAVGSLPDLADQGWVGAHFWASGSIPPLLLPDRVRSHSAVSADSTSETPLSSSGDAIATGGDKVTLTAPPLQTAAAMEVGAQHKGRSDHPQADRLTPSPEAGRLY
ncbi:hypothetical protein ABBQ38_008184 [Trebouxia sp. C0009 RCD-2024]